MDNIEMTNSTTPDAHKVQTPIMGCCANGHSLSPRFTKIAPDASQIKAAGIDDWPSSSAAALVIESMTSQQYVCDVCERCGLTVGVKNG
jgi:hypothetical protein